MSCSVLHHVEVCVKNDRIINLLTRGFGFTPFAHHVTPTAWKLALKSGDSIFVIVKRNPSVNNSLTNNSVNNGQNATLNTGQEQLNHIVNGDSNVNTDPKVDSKYDGEHWTVFCYENESQHTIDSVFNVALVVGDVDAVTKRVQTRGGQVLKEPSNLSDSKGHVRYSIVTSCCGNIVHTLIDKKGYAGSFLPGFEIIEESNGKMNIPDCIVNGFCNKYDDQPKRPSSLNLGQDNSQLHMHNGEGKSPFTPPISTYIDHVTYVCEVGKSQNLLSWYEYCFGMKRFMTNREESETEGFVLGDNIGLRLKVMEYWKCAETGLVSADNDITDTTLKLVIAEPLPEVSTSHVNTFLRAHQGPGVQHIGLHTPTMVATVDFMAKNGVVFRKAPPVYYEEGIKLDEIKEAGHGNEVELFRDLGILLDTEADVFTEMELDPQKKSYLMQVFTGPLFDEDTFFLEVIQRRGARGFGAGNITALARSIMLHNQKSED